VSPEDICLNYLGTEHSAVFATEIVHARTQKVAIEADTRVGDRDCEATFTVESTFCDFPSEFAENSGLRKMRPRRRAVFIRS